MRVCACVFVNELHFSHIAILNYLYQSIKVLWHVGLQLNVLELIYYTCEMSSIVRCFVHHSQ